jgi:hypothetical protein
VRIGRVLAVTAALAVVGVIAGAVGGGIGIGVLMAIFGVPRGPELTSWDLLTIAALIGAVCGIVAAPLLSWTALRRVPIWRCATETAFAAGVAAPLSLALFGGRPVLALATTAAAALLAAVRLRWAFRRQAAPESVSTPLPNG